MKIGLLTLHPHFNYGGILQCWALQYKLKELGHNIQLIHIRDKSRLTTQEKLRAPLSSLKNFIKRYLLDDENIVWQLPWHPEYRWGRQYYLDPDFIKSHINATSLF